MLTARLVSISSNFRITPKIESLAVFAIPDIPRKFQKKSFHNFLSYLANTQTDRQANKLWQKHNLLGGGKYDYR